MIKPTKSVMIGIKVIKALKASGKQVVSSEELARSSETTQAYLCQITKRLRKANLIQSHRGLGGGYSSVEGVVNGLQILKALNEYPQQSESDPVYNSILETTMKAYESLEF